MILEFFFLAGILVAGWEIPIISSSTVPSLRRVGGIEVTASKQQNLE